MLTRRLRAENTGSGFPLLNPPSPIRIPKLSSPVPLCCALIENEGKVLIAQRPLEHHLGGQ